MDNVTDDVLPEDFPIWSAGSTHKVKMAILRHYYMREIGLETVGLWRYHLETKLQEIMPWYTDLQNRLTDMASIFINATDESTDTLTHGHTIQKSGTDTTTVSDKSTDTGTVENSSTNASDGKVLVSDTPQNGLQAVLAGNYLTSATVDDNTTTVDGTETRNLTANRTGSSSFEHGMKDSHSGNDVRKVLRAGFSGDKVSVLKQYQELHLSIMQQIIRDCAFCWMGVLG